MARSHVDDGLSDSARAPMYAGSGARGMLTEADARALLAAHRASGSSLSRFARDRGIGADRLRWWQRRLRADRPQGNPPAPVRLVPVRVRSRAKPTHAAGSSFDLALSDGRWVRVPADFDASALRRLLGVLAAVT